MASGNRDRFVRLANDRVNRTIKAIRLIGNLSNRSNYSYSHEDVDKIFRTLNAEVRTAKSRFAEGVENTAQEFDLEE